MLGSKDRVVERPRPPGADLALFLLVLSLHLYVVGIADTAAHPSAEWVFEWFFAGSFIEQESPLQQQDAIAQHVPVSFF